MTDTTPSGDQIFVKSHVARDLLQNAALFKTDKLVVWEYVSNGLQYVDEGISPVVSVTLDSKKKRIVVVDNGRGMDWIGLQNFFVMHGENIDRREGRPGRGRFGTGKSAAFGIADTLRVRTVRDGKLSEVELRRDEIDKMNSEDPIPVRTIKRESAMAQPNGTVIEIEGIHLKALDQRGIIQYIERHLARWRNASVFVNNHECEFVEPPTVRTEIFRPEGTVKEAIGGAELIVKVASAPLDEELRGVSIYSNGVLHETTLAGNDAREMSQYIFGEIDVPMLDLDRSPIPPFDLSRSMHLNPSNETVQMIYAFVGQKIDQVRRELLKTEKERRASEEAKKLARQAEAIARVINEDFDEFRHRVAKARARAAGAVDAYPGQSGGTDGQDDFILGTESPAEVTQTSGGLGSSGGSRTGGTDPRTLGPLVEPASPDHEKRGQPAGGQKTGPQRRGGFRVEFKEMGSEANRALYVREERTIYINLDHPQLAAAKGPNSLEDALFQRLAYEIAFSEYAIALASELAARDEYIDPADPIIDIRETVNRIARRAASLYSVA